jgi:GNAT superfamily N-acetyltransferase
MIEYRLAAEEDFNRVLRFLKDHWREDHIFVRDSGFFRYEMCAVGAPQYLLAEAGDEIVGLIGFIPYSKEADKTDLFIAILRARPEYAAQGVGIKLLQGVLQLTSGLVSCVGVIPKALPLYTLVGFRTGYLDQFIWINPQNKAHKILQDVRPKNWEMSAASRLVRELGEAQLEALYGQLDQSGAPRKSFWYVKRRYLDHPIYSYRLQGVFEGNGARARLTGLGVTRVQAHEGAEVLRIVDWIGPLSVFPAFLRAVQEDCVARGCEGVDLYCAGIPEDLIAGNGWRRAEGNAVFPNYFSPYLAQNVPVTFATTAKEPLRLFRGDGDQDRPS